MPSAFLCFKFLKILKKCLKNILTPKMSNVLSDFEPHCMLQRKIWQKVCWMLQTDAAIYCPWLNVLPWCLVSAGLRVESFSSRCSKHTMWCDWRSRSFKNQSFQKLAPRNCLISCITPLGITGILLNFFRQKNVFEKNWPSIIVTEKSLEPLFMLE